MNPADEAPSISQMKAKNSGVHEVEKVVAKEA